MDNIPTTTDLAISHEERIRLSNGFLKPYKEYIYTSICRLGADAYDLLVPETSVLPMIIQPDEIVAGLVYGRYEWHDRSNAPIVGRGVLVATDKRALLIDKKWLFLRCDELGYGTIRAVSYSRVGWIGTIVLRTGLGDIKVRTFNQECAKHFVESIDKILSKPKTAT